MNMMTIHDVIRLSEAYKISIGLDRLTVNLAGLEPTLWWARPNLTVCDMIRELVSNGHQVEMTSNGSRLSELAHDLVSSGLSKCRVSIHSFDPETYYRIAGMNRLHSVVRGIDICRAGGLELTLNRTLLKGFTDDIPEVLDFISQRDMTLKLYDLWWVPRISTSWSQFYVHWSEVVKEYVIPISEKVTETHSKYHRSRRRYHLTAGGVVEVKVFDTSMHDGVEICHGCPLRSKCKETFGSYIHVFANGHMTFCNLREDVHLDLSSWLGENSPVEHIANFFRESFEEVMGTEWKERLLSGSLRFYINETCNYRCSFPSATRELWCLSSVRSLDTWGPEIFEPPPLIPLEVVSVQSTLYRVRQDANDHSVSKP